MIDEILERGETVEQCYEFLLAYAAQGLPGEEGSKGGQVRDFLNRAADALNGLPKLFQTLIEEEGFEPAEKYRAFHAVLERDARDSLAAVELVLAQPVISSELVDNLNASLHLRALLTDMFLLGDILRKARVHRQ